MSEQEIKDLFKIDIKEKNRTFENYTMRLLWSQLNKAKFKTITEHAKYLNLNHSSVSIMFKNENKHIADPKFIVLKEAFEKKDINIFNKYFDLKDKLYFEQLLILQGKTTVKPDDQIIRKYDKKPNKDLICAPKDKMQNVITKLRKLSKTDDRYYLWNKPLPVWNVTDWDLYFKI